MTSFCWAHGKHTRANQIILACSFIMHHVHLCHNNQRTKTLQFKNVVWLCISFIQCKHITSQNKKCFELAIKSGKQTKQIWKLLAWGYWLILLNIYLSKCMEIHCIYNVHVFPLRQICLNHVWDNLVFFIGCSCKQCLYFNTKVDWRKWSFCLHDADTNRIGKTKSTFHWSWVRTSPYY